MKVDWSESDLAILREVTQWFRQNRGAMNDVFGGAGPNYFQRPEVYIAIVQNIGTGDDEELPALETIAGVDVPGYRTCNIYQIVPNSTSFKLQLTAVDKQVYNISTSSLTASYLLVVRDKWGSWIAVETSNRNLLWRATVSTTVASIGPSAITVLFDAVDAGVTVGLGPVWGTIAGGELPVKIAGRLRSIIQIELISVNPDSSRCSVDAWLQCKPSGGAFTDVVGSAGRATVHNAAFGIYPSRICLNQPLVAAANDTYRVRAIVSNGPSAASLVGNDVSLQAAQVIVATTSWELEMR